MTTKKYQPETTHVSKESGLEYALLDGKWHFYACDGNWSASSNPIASLQRDLVPINYNEGELARSYPLSEIDMMFGFDLEDEPPQPQPQPQPQLSGGSCNYYMVDVKKPTTLEEAYTVECNDLIEALGLTWQEANIFKEIFRTANERTHGNGKDGNNPKRAAEKVLFFAIRNAILNGVDIEKFTSEINLK